jgi:hypothetical protein
MALLNVNPINHAQFQSTMKTMANEVKRCTLRWDEYVQFVARFTDAELKALPVQAGETAYNDTDVAYIRSAVLGMHNLCNMYNGEAKEGTDTPSYFIELIADAVVF